MKKKLLTWHDYLVPTGFGNVAKNLLQEAYLEWDVYTVGINYFGDQPYDHTKGFVYPVSESDPMGVKRLLKAAKQLQPDLIFLFQDHFNIAQVLDKLKEAAPQAKIICYFPVDGAPFSPLWKSALEVDLAITYTHWAKKVVQATLPQANPEILYHGVDLNVFKPLSQKEINQLRRKLGWQDKFTLINVNKYQPRKQVLTTLRVFSMFAKGHKACSCGHVMTWNHQLCERCHGEELTFYPPVTTRTKLYLHMNPYEPHMGRNHSNSLVNLALSAGFTDEDVKPDGCLVINQQDIYGEQGYTEEEINQFYNAANLNITTTCGEGAGLSLLESLATGTPSLAPFNSAIPEMIEDTGYLARTAGFFSMALDNGHARPIVDERHMLELLIKAYGKFRGGKEPDQKCISLAQQKFSWEDKREWLMQKFREVSAPQSPQTTQ